MTNGRARIQSNPPAPYCCQLKHNGRRLIGHPKAGVYKGRSGMHQNTKSCDIGDPRQYTDDTWPNSHFLERGGEH